MLTLFCPGLVEMRKSKRMWPEKCSYLMSTPASVGVAGESPSLPHAVFPTRTHSWPRMDESHETGTSVLSGHRDFLQTVEPKLQLGSSVYSLPQRQTPLGYFKFHKTLLIRQWCGFHSLQHPPSVDVLPSMLAWTLVLHQPAAGGAGPGCVIIHGPSQMKHIQGQRMAYWSDSVSVIV